MKLAPSCVADRPLRGRRRSVSIERVSICVNLRNLRMIHRDQRDARRAALSVATSST
jgi:hypothetical protein